MTWAHRIPARSQRYHADFLGWMIAYPNLVPKVADQIEVEVPSALEPPEFYLCFEEKDWEKVNARLWNVTTHHPENLAGKVRRE